jgi:hypothetical protein
VVRDPFGSIGKLAAVAVLWLVLAGLCALMAWPHVPRTWSQGLLFVVVAPPIYVLGEFVGGWFFSEKHGRAISSSAFSFARIGVALIVVVAAMLVSWWLSATVFA